MAALPIRFWLSTALAKHLDTLVACGGSPMTYEESDVPSRVSGISFMVASTPTRQ